MIWLVIFNSYWVVFSFAIPPSFIIVHVELYIPFCEQRINPTKSDNCKKEAEFPVSKLSYVSCNRR